MFDDTTVRSLLLSSTTIAIVGAKDVAGQPVDRVGRYLLAQGYDVLPVHPVRRSAWGLPAVAALSLLPRPADIVVLFRAPRFCPGHAREILALSRRPCCVWMQEGITSPEARALLEGVGLLVVEDRCIMMEHRRLVAGAAPVSS